MRPALRSAAWWAVPSLAAVATYANTLRCGFVFDDNLQILSNPWVQELRFLPRLVARPVWAFFSTYPSNYYRPVQMGLYGLLWAIGGGRPIVFHLMNVALHAAVTALLALWVQRVSGDRRLAWGAALLFAVHPANTETVAWIACVPELTYSLCLLAALGLHVAGRRWTALGLFALALLSKETALVLIPLVLLFELRSGRPLRASASYAGVALAYLGLRFAVLGGLAPHSGGIGAAALAMQAPTLLASYLRVLVAPVHLLAYHVTDPVRSLLELRSLGACGLLAIAGAAGVWLGRRRPDLGLAAALVVLPLLPALLVPGTARVAFAERYTYLSTAGAAWLVAALALTAARRNTRAFIAAIAVVALPLGAAAAWRNRVWVDDRTLAEATLRDEPRASTMYVLLAKWYERRGDEDRALTVYADGLRQVPGDPFLAVSRTGLELSLSRLQPEAAIAALEPMTQRYPWYYDAWVGLGAALLKAGRPADAESTFRRAVEINPNARNGYDGLVLAQLAQGREPDPGARAAAGIDPTRQRAEDLRLQGVAHAAAGRLEQAEQVLQEALRVRPSVATWIALAVVASKRGDDAAAIVRCRSALALDANAAAAWEQLGVSAQRLGDLRQAVDALEHGAALAPMDKLAHYRLGRVYAMAG
ncbi:MAG TPA: tetratricopeptide repeat protein, partial [Candidatus Polarisedimenticolaceae bacterium]|nr:tetratricopeptide repeat protein [Candidatus Polarisedimenticolaceae bacterium]